MAADASLIKRGGVHVLVVPYPAQGHMLALLDLADVLSTRFLFAITVAVTPVNRPLLSPLLDRAPDVSALILPFPDYPDLPPGLENTKDLSPPQFRLLQHALGGLHDPLLRWARSHPDPPVAIISDFFCGWTQHLAEDLGIRRVVFSPSGAFGIAAINSLWRRMPQRSNPDDPVDFSALPKSPIFSWYQISSVYRSYIKGELVPEFVREGFLSNIKSWGWVLNTFSELEAMYLDHLREDLGHSRVWAVGPVAAISSIGERGGLTAVAREEVTTWLDGCEIGSVLYVAFGSQKVLSPEQASAVAAALDRSAVRFIWSARDGTLVPEGFDERVRGRGLVIRGWAPQLAILNHESVGSFMTHCGWNSVLEAVAAGVVLVTWPMTADQFTNARLVVEDAGIGMVACMEGPEAVPGPDKLSRVFSESVGEASRERRKKAKELRKAAAAAAAVEEGGSSYRDLEDFVADLSRLKL